jgi:peptidoglycan/LPS O-acetylase OafA/YrhL
MSGLPIQEHPSSVAVPKYRPDVDGLRAVAILSVLGFHAFPQWIRGGFIGVDVFFVISGFLISTVIVGELERQRFSFLNFYQRRIRRIIPALVLVLVACAGAGWYLLPRDAYAQLGRHIAAGAGFGSNFLLWKEAGYFDSASDAKPLLHLWSLAIEEQFYVVWPLVLAFAWRRRWNLLVVTTVLLAASFIANLAMIRTDAVANFYLPTTRMWELLIGAALIGTARIHPHRKLAALRQRFSNPLACAGLAALGIAGWLLTKESMFPGGWALLPTLGAAAIIAAGPAAWVNRRLFAHPLMVWIGLISYPLYLWHWPILAFLRIAGVFEGAVETGLCAIGASFVLAWLTYRLVERPFRSDRSSPRAPFGVDRSRVRFKALGLVAGMVLTAVLGVAVQRADSMLAADRFQVAALPPLPDKRVFEDMKIYEHIDRPTTTCRDRLKLDPVPEEVCIANSAHPKVLFFGDSHAMGLYSAIFANQVATPSVLIASPGCLVYPNLVHQPIGKAWGQNCTDIAKKGVEFARQSPDIETIVVSLVRKGDNPSKPTLYHADGKPLTEIEVLDSGTDHLIGALLSTGKNVIYVVDVPYFHDTPENCQARFLISKSDTCMLSRSKMNSSFKDYFDVLARVQKKYPALKILNAEGVLCQGDVCTQHDGKQYFYVDKDHLSVYGSGRILERLFHQFPVN